MYVPRHFAVEDLEEIRGLVRDVHVGQLVTVGADGVPNASLLPVLWEGDEVVVHLARANEHWRRVVDGSPCLVVVTGPDAYITPRWYASKREHGRVVPTWNYVTAHVFGRLVIRDEVDYVRRVVGLLTAKHEAASEHPWAITDAPERFIDGQLRAIVGVELQITRIEAKAKLSQNRPTADVQGVVAGLQQRGDDAMTEAVARILR